MEKWFALISFPFFPLLRAFVSVSHRLMGSVVKWCWWLDALVIFLTNCSIYKNSILPLLATETSRSTQRLLKSVNWQLRQVLSWLRNLLSSSFCGSSRAVRVKTSTPSTNHCVCTPFSTNQAWNTIPEAALDYPLTPPADCTFFVAQTVCHTKLKLYRQRKKLACFGIWLEGGGIIWL